MILTAEPLSSHIIFLLSFLLSPVVYPLTAEAEPLYCTTTIFTTEKTKFIRVVFAVVDSALLLG